MKNKLTNVIKSVLAFVKAHSISACIIALLITAIIVALACKDYSENAPANKNNPETIVSSKNDETSNLEAQIVPEVNTSSENQETSDEVLSDKNETSLKTSTIINTSTNKPSNKPVSGNTTVSKPSTNNNVVQIANTDTGISWDGKSQIIYTYPDGTTGTKKKVGATYEQVPGIVATVIDENSLKEEFNPNCDKCGKTMGDGTNGTCLSYWTGGDHACPHCSVIIPVKTCHTCNK